MTLTNGYWKIILITAIAVCVICLFAKSFLALHTYPEYDPGTTLMFKLNPLAANIVHNSVLEDRYHTNQTSPLRIYHDESVLGEETLVHIFKIPLPIYLFTLLFLTYIYRKTKNGNCIKGMS